MTPGLSSQDVCRVTNWLHTPDCKGVTGSKWNECRVADLGHTRHRARTGLEARAPLHSSPCEPGSGTHHTASHTYNVILGSPVYHLASHSTDNERHSLSFSFLTIKSNMSALASL
jgi:hypothetical protein